jgi:murein DD-endopeptidase MepM/ murein hydrolase activator NlpD
MPRHGADSPRQPDGRARRSRRLLPPLLATAGLIVAAAPATADTASGGVSFSATAPAAAAPAATAPPATASSSPAPAPPAEGAPAAAAPAASPAVPVTRTVPLTRTQTKSVQRKVRVRPDGVLGSRTQVAIRRYQSRRALMRTGRPNLQTLRDMKLAFAEKIAARLSSTAHAAVPVVVVGYAWRYGGSATVFGAGRNHQGVDMFAACGTPLGAASTGTVKVNTFQSRAGNYVVLTDTPSGEDQVYMHLESRSPLAVGTRVEAGSPVGFVGDTGRADGCHLHFELWSAPGWYAGGAPHDPRKTLDAWAAASGTKPNARAGR